MWGIESKLVELRATEPGKWRGGMVGGENSASGAVQEKYGSVAGRQENFEVR